MVPGQLEGQRRLPRRRRTDDGERDRAQPIPLRPTPRGCGCGGGARRSPRPARPIRWCGLPAVMRTSAKVPGRSGTRGLRDSAPACSAGCGRSARPGPSCSDPRSRTSSTRPTRAWWRARPDRSITTRSRAKRSATTSGGHELVGPLGRLGAGSGRVDERVGAVVGGLGRHLEGGLEVVVGLAGEPDDEVGGDGQVVDRGPGQRPAARGSARRCSRGAWRPGRASLPDWSGRCRCGHTAGWVGHGLDGLGPQVLRVRAGVADPADALDLGHRAEQVGEQRAGPAAGIGGPRRPATARRVGPGSERSRWSGRGRRS